jgi:apolipoprotein N-acyltransferase
MRRGEALALGFLLVFSAVTFLPVWREIELGGMVVFGWLMAALMLLSPAVALIVFLRYRRGR